MAVSSALRYQPTIRDLPTGERPRERLVEYGSKHLSNTELVAILLRTGIAGENVLSVSSRLLSRFGSLRGLGRAAFTELSSEKWLSETKACQLLAALELGRRFVSLAPEERLTVNSPEDVANLVAGEIGALAQEHLRVILLNIRNEVVGTDEIYVGNVNTSVVRPAEVFRPAVRNNATAIIVVHNHPSGDPSPSEQDIEITRELAASGKILGVEALGHRQRQPVREHPRNSIGVWTVAQRPPGSDIGRRGARRMPYFLDKSDREPMDLMPGARTRT